MESELFRPSRLQILIPTHLHGMILSGPSGFSHLFSEAHCPFHPTPLSGGLPLLAHIWRFTRACLCEMQHQTLVKSQTPYPRRTERQLGKLARPCRGPAGRSSSNKGRACSYSGDISADLAARLNYQKSRGALPNLELNHKQAVERQLQVSQATFSSLDAIGNITFCYQWPENQN